MTDTANRLSINQAIVIKSSGNFHDSERFVLILFRGSPVTVRVNGRKYSAIAPGCLCFNESEKAEVLSYDTEPVRIFFHPGTVNSIFTFDNIYKDKKQFTVSERLDRDFLEPFVNRTENYFGYLPLGPAIYEKIFSLSKILTNELAVKKDNFWPCRSRSYFLEILFLLFKVYHDHNIIAPVILDDSLFGRIINYIHCNYSEKIFINDLCKKYSTNKTSLNKEFHSRTGGSVLDYIIKVRVNAACLLLRDTTLPVQEIVYRTGFNDTAHFGRMFKRIIQMPAGEYRKKYSNAKKE